MMSARIPESLAALVERLTPEHGQRTAFVERALAREALRASGAHPQAVDAAVDGGKGEPGASS